MKTLLLLLSVSLRLAAQDVPDEALQSVRKLRVPKGLKVELFAAEPQFVNPVALSIDDRGRLYVAETHRRHSAVLEVWDRRDWLDGDLAARTVEDRVALYRKNLGAAADKLSAYSERIRVIHGSISETFAEGFNDLADGLGSSVLARGSDVWYTCAPNLWHLTVGPDGKAMDRRVLATGFGVHMGSGAHDLHGLCMGPDGKLYFSMGDRGFHVVTKEGKTLDSPDCGAVLRCDPDGGGLEVFATGLRNPEQLCFDAQGNLWTGDNNSDAGDKARWIWVVEGADYGWRFGYQREVLKSPWMLEKLWTTEAAPSQVPPAGYVGHGPSGVACYPGTGLTDAYAGRFFMCDFPGSVRSFAVKARGAGFEVVDEQTFLSELWPTDCKFGPDGALYVSDWVQGWAKPEKGRIFKVTKAGDDDADTGRLLGDGMAGRTIKDLHDLLYHRDVRVRLAAQFELVARKSTFVLGAVAMCGEGPSQLHAIWGLGQLNQLEFLSTIRNHPHSEVRAQVARVQADRGLADGMIPGLLDVSSRVRFYSALALGKAKAKDAVRPLLEMLRENNDQDPWLRHAGVFALASIGDVPALLAAAKDPRTAVRMASLLALRRLGSPDVRRFLQDADAEIVFEAARAIHDVPIAEATEDLAQLLRERRLPERVAVRAVNAALRASRADLLVAYVRNAEASEDSRVQALDALADWIWPNARDRVLGAWRPLLPRPVPDDLIDVFRDLSAEAQPERIRVHALRAWGELTLAPSPLLRELLKPETPPAVRVEALRTMAKTKDAAAKDAITSAIEDKEAALREEAVRLLVEFRLPNTAGLLEKLALARGALAVRQAAVASLGDWKGDEADGVLSRLLDQTLELPSGLYLDLIEAAGKRGAAEVKAKLARFESARTPNVELLEGGDAKIGREIFFERLDVSCARCHAVKDKGGVVGPPLTKVGGERTKEQILESILLPNKVIVQGYAQVLLKLDDDAIEVGRVEKETSAEMVLVLGDGSKKKIAKSTILARKEGLSAMPDDISKALSRRDLRNLVAYLVSLK